MMADLKSKISIETNRLGDGTAENDRRMLTSAFVPTADFRSLIESDERTVVVGRRGTGKSALFLELQNHWKADKRVQVLGFAPEDDEVIGFRAMLKPFSTSFNLARASTRLLWRYAILMEVACALEKNYKTSKQVDEDELVSAHVNRWRAARGSLLQKCRLIAKGYLSVNSPEEAVGDLSGNLELSDIESNIFSILSKTERKFVVLMDRLDEGYEPDPIGIGIITGLVYASIELNKKSDKIRPIIFLRDNIYRAVSKEDPDYSRNIEGQVIRLHWDWAQLLLLVAARMRISFGLELERDQRIWDRCTAGELQGREGFKRCLQFTLYRPRDLLSLLNEAFYYASRDGRQTAILADLDRAAQSISHGRLEDLWKEYQRIFPSIQEASNAFANGEPEFTAGDATEVLRHVVETLPDSTPQGVMQDFRLLEPSGILQGLYSVGFLGVHEPITSAFTFCHDGRTPNKAFADDERLLIHPCYWLGLNLTRNALKPEEAEEITDEYDIKVESTTPEIRKARIGQIVAQLDKIPQGRDGDREFESWCLDALRTIFAMHLTNIQPHPNGAAVQRRDIVGRNREASEFWRRAHTDYGVRQVVFETKNYVDVGATEYRQVRSYLTGVYGRLGFMITRDVDESPRTGKDLDWIKELNKEHNVVILKFPAKYICKLLQKLRSPEKHDAVDKQVGALLDSYERNYLSIKTTRPRR